MSWPEAYEEHMTRANLANERGDRRRADACALEALRVLVANEEDVRLDTERHETLVEACLLALGVGTVDDLFLTLRHLVRTAGGYQDLS